MELWDPHRFSHVETSAPALNRGLAVLTALGNQQAPLSLDTLAGKLSLPKASVYRLLATLQEIGMVRKTPDKCYEPLWTLHPLQDRKLLFRQRVEKHMTRLCQDSGCTVEWYEPAPEGMTLIKQANPDNELHVKARPGFIRHWGVEFEAVARLAYAFDPAAPPPGPVRMFVSNGVSKTLPPKEALRLLHDARAKKSSVDLPFNDNGVRRCAAVALDDGHFRGILALAEAFHFSRPDRSPFYIKQLKKTLKAL